jgi:carboxymethylenebutenolidase
MKIPELSRRGFVVTSLATGFALAVEPVSAETIHTDAEGLVAGEVKVPVADGQIPAYRAMPDKGGPFPTVLVVHEIFGVHEHIQDICRRLAKVGYFAIAPDLFARQGNAAAIKNMQLLYQKIILRVPDAGPRHRRRLRQGDRQGGSQPARRHRILLGRPDRLALRRP